MPPKGKARHEAFADKMSLVRIFESDRANNKLPCLANFIHPGDSVAERYLFVYVSCLDVTGNKECK